MLILIKYKGQKIYVKISGCNIDYISFKYNQGILLYVNKNIDKKGMSRALHKSLKKAR